MLKAVLGALVALIAVVLVSSEANAQDMTQELEEWKSVCLLETERGFELEATDGCLRSAESLGIELDNVRESEAKQCMIADLLEDLSCKGSPEPSSYSSSTVSEQSCVTVDMTDPEVSGQDIVILTKGYGFDAKADNDELLYGPECFEQGVVEWDWDAMVNNPCYDVLSDASGEEYWVEYIGCSEVPVTQEGTYAPLNWRDRVVELKPAASYKSVSPSSKKSSTARPTTSTLSTTNPY